MPSHHDNLKAVIKPGTLKKSFFVDVCLCNMGHRKPTFHRVYHAEGNSGYFVKCRGQLMSVCLHRRMQDSVSHSCGRTQDEADLYREVRQLDGKWVYADKETK